MTRSKSVALRALRTGSVVGSGTVGGRATRDGERRLLAAARDGDARALDRLVALLAPPVFRFGRAFCRDRHDAEDVMQETLASLVRELRAFRGQSSLSTWAFVVARNACARMRRRRARDARAVESLVAHGEAAPAVPASEPDREFHRGALGEALGRAIRALPAPWREAVLLRDVEGRSTAETARALGIGVRALKSRLHRARAALRIALQQGASTTTVPERVRPVGRGCPDLPLVLSRYLEGDLNATVCAELESHVSGCDACGQACDELMASLARCRRAGTSKPPLPVRRAVRAAIRRAVDSTRRS